MNYLLKILTFLFVVQLGFSQDSSSVRIKEYYLSMGTFSPVSAQLRYKRQIGKKMFFKLGLIDLSWSLNASQPSANYKSILSSRSAGLELGIEFRKNFGRGFAIFHGPNISVGYQNYTSNLADYTFPGNTVISKSETYTGRIPYSVGILFNLNTHLLVSAEISPGIYASFSESYTTENIMDVNNSASIGFGFNNQYGIVSLVYRR